VVHAQYRVTADRTCLSDHTAGRPALFDAIFEKARSDPHTSGPGFLQTVASQQIVGEIMGVTIVVDSNITQTAGDSENEDVAYLMRASDLCYGNPRSSCG
jgi:hypothetical protein